VFAEGTHGNGLAGVGGSQQDRRGVLAGPGDVDGDLAAGQTPTDGDGRIAVVVGGNGGAEVTQRGDQRPDGPVPQRRLARQGDLAVGEGRHGRREADRRARQAAVQRRVGGADAAAGARDVPGVPGLAR